MFWKNKKVLITGHTGFKGSWLALWLQHLGAKVSGFALPPSMPTNLFTLAKVAQGMNSHIGDLREFEQIMKIVKQEAPEIIIHMAAQALVRQSYKTPLETYATNVMGTIHLLEAARLTESVRTILNVTTDKCYENKKWLRGYHEEDQLGGYDPYSNSKACSELVTQAYRSSFFNELEIGIGSARAGNVIGGGDWSEDRLIPDLMIACFNNQSVTLRYPASIRPWQHVLEPLSGYLLLTEKLHIAPKVFAQSWNFGPNENDVKPVSWVTDFIFNHWKNPKGWLSETNKQPHEAACLKLDCTKSLTKLGWQPKWDISKGLIETMLWYKAYQANEDMQNVTLNQIKQFMAQPIRAL